MSRTDSEHADRYAFYLAYGQVCGYCRKHLDYGEVQIDHVVPQHLAKEAGVWQKVVDDYGLPSDFQVDSDENRMASCGQDNCHKSGDLLPVGQTILLLNIAGKKAPLVREERIRIVTERQRGRTLANVQKAWTQSSSFRDDLLAVIEPYFPAYKAAAVQPWTDRGESSRVKRLLGGASEALLAWPQDIEGEWIERHELAEMEAVLSRPRDEPVIFALLGPPGSGKSAMLARLGNTLRNRGSILLALKADFLPSEVGSLVQFDEWLQAPESLPILLERLAAESPVTILVDQLDALAELMDTRTERLSALLSVIDRTWRIPGVKIVVSCRNFDAMHDLRLRSLIERAGTTKIDLTDPTWKAVSEFVMKQGFDPRSWPDCVKEMLRRPQHLKLFLKHFNARSDRPTFENYHGMLERILQERVLKPFGPRAVSALNAMTAEMAAREELWLPRVKVEQQFRNELIQLQEAGLVSVSPDLTRVGFGHQTVFDFLRARSFVVGTRKLFDDVKARQDGLTVRGELWSSIGYLRNADSILYRTELVALLGSSEMRRHVQILLIEFLGTVSQPTREEASCIRPLLENPDLRPHIMRAIAKSPEWFSLMRSAIAQSHT